MDQVNEVMSLTRQVTRVGCGLAGYKDEDIAPLFHGAPVNCLFDERWRSYLGDQYRYFTHTGTD